MRTAVLIAAAALAAAGCDKIQNPFAKTADKPAAAPAAIQAAPPAPVPAPPAADLNAAPATAQAAAPAARPPTAPDYARRDRRLDALIANAETRDGSGETQRRAEEGRYRRAHCATRACIESSYATEEAWLKQWEGSGDVR